MIYNVLICKKDGKTPEDFWANCKRNNGRPRTSRINLNNCIANQNGLLVSRARYASHPQSSRPKTDNKLTALYSGNYKISCKDCYIAQPSRKYLICACRKNDGGWQD